MAKNLALAIFLVKILWKEKNIRLDFTSLIFNGHMQERYGRAWEKLFLAEVQ